MFFLSNVTYHWARLQLVVNGALIWTHNLPVRGQSTSRNGFGRCEETGVARRRKTCVCWENLKNLHRYLSNLSSGWNPGAVRRSLYPLHRRLALTQSLRTTIYILLQRNLRLVSTLTQCQTHRWCHTAWDVNNSARDKNAPQGGEELRLLLAEKSLRDILSKHHSYTIIKTPQLSWSR